MKARRVVFPSTPEEAAAIVSTLGPGEIAETDCNCGGTVSFRVTDAEGSSGRTPEPVCPSWAAHSAKVAAGLK